MHTHVTHILAWLFITLLAYTLSLPPKIDLGIVIDNSKDMGYQGFDTAKQFMFNCLDYLSISPGTTRVGFYTIGESMKEIFHFKEHVNRECVLKAIKKIDFKGEDKPYDVQEQMYEAIKQMQSNSRKVLEPRKLYFILTNTIDDLKDFESKKIKLASTDVIALIHIEENDVILLDKNQSNGVNNVSKNQSDDLGNFKSTAENNMAELEAKSEHDEANSYNGILKHSKNTRKKLINNTSFLQDNNKTQSIQNNDKTKTRNNNLNIKLLAYKEKSDVKKILKELDIPFHSFTECHVNNSEKIYDECKRQCTCRNGRLTNCYRVRQEITAMSVEDRKRYLRAYKTLTSVSPYKEIFERYVFMHYKYFCWGIHNRDYFLPWHRWFISEMEDLLKQIDCRVNLAFWDWSVVSNDPWNRNGLWRSTDDGIGGNGNRFKGYCVQKGLFRETDWETPYWEDPMDIILSTADQLNGNITQQRGHLAFCLRRAFKGLTPSLLSVKRTLALPAKRFQDFDIQMRHNYHDRIHNIIGGTMCTHYAADTPEFWMHHAMLDNIWYRWQQKSRQHLYVHFLQRNHTKMMGTKYTQKELIDCNDLPRCIKIKYKKFPLLNRDKRGYDDIDDMARTSHKYWDQYLNQSWYGKFPDCKRSKKEKKRAKYLHKVLDGPGDTAEVY